MTETKSKSKTKTKSKPKTETKSPSSGLITQHDTVTGTSHVATSSLPLGLSSHLPNKMHHKRKVNIKICTTFICTFLISNTKVTKSSSSDVPIAVSTVQSSINIMKPSTRVPQSANQGIPPP